MKFEVFKASDCQGMHNSKPSDKMEIPIFKPYKENGRWYVDIESLEGLLLLTSRLEPDNKSTWGDKKWGVILQTHDPNEIEEEINLLDTPRIIIYDDYIE